MFARAVALLAAAAFTAPLAVAADAPRRMTVLARPGETARVATELSRGALRVVRRRGRVLEIVAPPSRARALGALAGVASVAEAPTAFGDEVVGEGVQRSGAAPMIDVGNGGRGLTIAVIDLGFGTSLSARQAAGELPPSSRLQFVSFDPVKGIAGANAYGNATNHGELVAQTVYDYAPNARYIFVSYHTEGDFLAAAEWLTARRPDIVVHSNSFIEGTFDGAGPEAQAVDRAAAVGILWFNSAGNYAENHWSGPWADADGDGALDLAAGGVFERQAGAPITFALSWSVVAGETPPDLDLVLEAQSPDGSWVAVRTSADVQAAGARPSERVVGYVPPAQGFYRVRAVHMAGPEPAGVLTLFSREVPLGPLGGSSASSVPTPGDAAGSITVGAVDWRGNTLKSYSSQGPTLDGRAKPDVVAPTNTRILSASGPRSVGGTSNAAPNAAGVAAVLLAARRVAKIPFSYDAVRAILEDTALDLGEPGSDPAFGFGRVRAEVDSSGALADLAAPRIGGARPRSGPAAGRRRFRRRPVGDPRGRNPPHGPAAARRFGDARHAVTGRRPAHGRGGGPGHAGKRRPGELHDRGRQHPSRRRGPAGGGGEPRCARGRRGRLLAGACGAAGAPQGEGGRVHRGWRASSRARRPACDGRGRRRCPQVVLDAFDPLAADRAGPPGTRPLPHHDSGDRRRRQHPHGAALAAGAIDNGRGRAGHEGSRHAESRPFPLCFLPRRIHAP